MSRRVQHSPRLAAIVLWFCIPPVFAAAQSDTNDSQQPPQIAMMTRHGLAGIVTAITGSRIVMQIPENVDITVTANPSTRVTDRGLDAALGAIHIGDAIFASGDLDEQMQTLQAIAITIQPGRAAQLLRIRHDNFGKTWTAGIIAAVRGDSVTLQRMDGQSQTFAVDAGTGYQLRDQPADFAMLRPGERVNVQFRLGQQTAAHVNIAGMTRAN